MSAAAPPSTFREWRQLSHQLTADCQQLDRMASHAGQPELAAAARALYRRVEERRFTVAVIGEFKRGKSTFLNALLGADVLPADVVPTTATLNRVTWGSRPSVSLVYHDGRPPQSIPIEALASHVTQLDETAQRNAAAVREAVIQYPVRLCRNDVDLIDTPGLSDEAHLTETTLRVLPEVDAAILVVMADSPFSAAEEQLLGRLLAEGLARVFVVVNAMDRIRRPADRQRVLDAVRARVARHGDVPVFGVSALDALEARRETDASRLEQSGLPALEAELERLLTRADALGLARRVESLLGLCASLHEVLAAPGADHQPAELDLVLTRCEALLHALDTLLERSRRDVLDLGTRALVGLDDDLARWPVSTLRRLVPIINRDPAGRDWPHAATERCAELAARLDEAIVAAGVELGQAAEARLIGGLSDEHRASGLHRAVGTVLEHVDAELAGLGLPSGAWTAPASPIAELSDLVRVAAAALGAELSPGPARLAAVLDAPTLRADMERYRSKSGFDRLLALDLGGTQGRWSSLARAHVEALCEAAWSAHAPKDALRDRLDEVVRRLLHPLEPAADAVAQARQRVFAARQRAVVLAEREASTRARDLADLAALRDRARAAAAALAAG